MQIRGADDLARDLGSIGLSSGDGVFVHSALSQIGHVIGGPRGLITALTETVGAAGLVGMPGFSRDSYDPCNFIEGEVSPEDQVRIKAQTPGFDPDLSNVRQNGSVAEAFRAWPGVARSPHPTSSVLLWGDRAADLCAEHDAHDWPTGPKSPWGRLCEIESMKILLIGVKWNRCSALHAAESRARHRRVAMRHFKLSSAPNAPWIDAPDVADDNSRLFPPVGEAFEETGQVRIGQIGGAEARLFSYRALVEFASDWLDARNAADGVAAVD